MTVDACLPLRDRLWRLLGLAVILTVAFWLQPLDNWWDRTTATWETRSAANQLKRNGFDCRSTEGGYTCVNPRTR